MTVLEQIFRKGGRNQELNFEQQHTAFNSTTNRIRLLFGVNWHN